jgi:hypothetical protein
LRGPDGNPSAIGARVALRGADGSRQVREVHAGGGCLGQGEPRAWFPAAAEGAVVEVRWPDGSVSETKLAQRVGVVTIAR